MTHINLDVTRYTSRALAQWAASRPGFAERTGYESTVGTTLQVSNQRTYPVVSSDSGAMKELFQPILSASGFPVNERSAMMVSTVYACIRINAGAMLQLPCNQYTEDKEGNRDQVRNSSLWWLLNEQPHPMWTASNWKEWIVRCVALRGDQYTRILRSSANKGGQVTGLEPLHPDFVIPRVWVADDGSKRLVYDILDRFTGQVDTVDQDDMLHFTGLGFDGVRSLSAITYAARQAVGNSLAAAEYTGRTVGEGAMPQIALKFANKMTKEQAQALRESFVATYSGVGNRKFPLVLTEGGDVKQLSISPVDMQLLEMRNFESTAINEVTGVPPVLIGKTEKVSAWGAGIEQITLGYVKFTVKPMAKVWRDELNRKLFRRAGQYVEFDMTDLLRGDSKALAEFYKAALGGPGSGDGWMSQNEVRRLQHLPPKANGDTLFKAQAGTTAKPTKPDTTDGEPA